MALTLKNFKKTIPSNILTRGRDYLRSGRVVDLSQDDDDTWLAEVQGSTPYQVTIVQQADGALECRCTCPYDFGEHCKHVAAVLYAIEEAFPEYFEGTRRKPAGRRTRMDRLREALQAAPPERLVATLLDLAQGDREMQSKLLLLLNVADRPDDIRALVKATVRPPRGNFGFLDFWQADQAGRKLSEIVGRADRLLLAHPQGALRTYQIVLEEAVVALKNADDSTGSLSANVVRALEGLDQCAERLPPEERAALFDYCLEQANGPRFEGWDYGWRLRQLAGELVETPAQREALLTDLQPFETVTQSNNRISAWSEHWRAEQAAEIKLNLIKRLDGEEAALAFVADNIHLTGFRLLLIQHHLDAGDLDAAGTLAQEGLAAVQANNLMHGIAYTYRQLLLTIAQQRDDREAIAAHASSLWLSQGGPEYYDLMVGAVLPEEWAAFRTRLLSDEACSPELAASAYAYEEMWPELRDIVFAYPRLLRSYQLELEAHYPDETAVLYEQLAREMLRRVSNRPTYNEAASYLTRMQKLGHGDEGKAIARALMEQYPQRRAMIEELRRVL